MSYSINIRRGQAVSIQDGNISIPIASENTDYQAVLDAIIEQGAACFDGDIPEDLQAAADAKQFAKQLEDYREAVDRLAQYVVADGRAEYTNEVVVGQEWDESTEAMVDVVETITVPAIDPVDATVERETMDADGNLVSETIENPLITVDNEERAAAQAVVDATPQAVKDAA